MPRYRWTLVAATVLALAACSSDSPTAAPSPTTPTAAPSSPNDPPPADSMPCSTAAVRVVLADQPGLPAPVAATRQAIFDAAIACDWDALGALAGDDLSFSFGADDDPIRFWRGMEEGGHSLPPMHTLVTLLNLPYVEASPGDDVTYYTWPSAFQERPTDDDWAAVEAAFGPEQVAAWRTPDGRYLGYRVGITADGDWAYFIAGD